MSLSYRDNHGKARLAVKNECHLALTVVRASGQFSFSLGPFDAAFLLRKIHEWILLDFFAPQPSNKRPKSLRIWRTSKSGRLKRTATLVFGKLFGAAKSLRTVAPYLGQRRRCRATLEWCLRPERLDRLR